MVVEVWLVRGLVHASFPFSRRSRFVIASHRQLGTAQGLEKMVAMLDQLGRNDPTGKS